MYKKQKYMGILTAVFFLVVLFGTNVFSQNKVLNYSTLSKGNAWIEIDDEITARNQLTNQMELLNEYRSSRSEEIVYLSPDDPAIDDFQYEQLVFDSDLYDYLGITQIHKGLIDGITGYNNLIDEPNIGRPISGKVAETMRKCTSAIVIFTADEEYKDKKENIFYRPSDNTIYELGAASILYDNKIVILKEKEVVLASDFSDLGYISFEKDKLDAKAMDIVKELIGFGLLKVTPA